MVKNTRQKMMVALISIIVALLLLELLARQFSLKMNGSSWSWAQSGCFTIDATLIYKPIKGRECTIVNQLGLKIVPGNKVTPNAANVVILGDSFVWGDTSIDTTYPAVLQELFNKNKYNVNVYNMGVPGYGIDQEYVFFSQLEKQIKPKIVIWNIHVNDNSDDFNRPLFQIKNNKLVQIPGWTSGLFWSGLLREVFPLIIYEHSFLLNYILYTLNNINLFHLDNRIDGQEWSFGKMIITVGEMDRRAERNNFDLFYVLSPSQSTIENISPSLIKQDQKILDRYKKILDQRPFIDGTQLFLNWKSQTKASSTSSTEEENRLFLDQSSNYPDGAWHPNEKGNYLLAKLAFDYIKQNHLLEKNQQ